MMFNNCGNMGLPLAALAFGPRGLSAMVAVFTDLEPAAFHRRRVDDRPPRALRPAAAGIRWSGRRSRVSRSRCCTSRFRNGWQSGFKLVGDALIPMMLLFARRAPARRALERLAHRRHRRPRLPVDRHRDGGAARLPC
jgi:hypothetical protein